MLFEVLDALVEVGLVQRSDSLCSGKFVKWLGFQSLKHTLLKRLELQKIVTKQESDALQISQTTMKVLLYAGVIEEVIQIID